MHWCSVAKREVHEPNSAEQQTYYVHNDHLGTPRVLTDDSQQVLWQIASPFGQVTNEQGLLEQPVRFPGQYADVASGYSYNYFRDYDPSLGRYIQSDPIGLRGGLNTYGYVGGNPINWIDPFGLFFSVGGVSTGMAGGSHMQAGSVSSAVNGAMSREAVDNLPGGAWDSAWGAADSVSNGWTRTARHATGYGDSVDEDSPGYCAANGIAEALGHANIPRSMARGWSQGYGSMADRVANARAWRSNSPTSRDTRSRRITEAERAANASGNRGGVNSAVSEAWGQIQSQFNDALF